MEVMYTGFYICGRIPSMSVYISVYSLYTGRNKGYTERCVEGKYTDFVYFMDNDLWFLIRIGFVLLRFLGILNLKTFQVQFNISTRTEIFLLESFVDLSFKIRLELHSV